MNPAASPALSPLAARIVQQLVQARRGGQVWQDPDFDPALDAASAYAIQDAVAAALGWFADGRVPAWKAGGKDPMTAAPLPQLLASGATWHPGGSAHLIAEAETAFRLQRTPATAAEVVDCIGTMCVSIELVGTRMAKGLSAPAAWKTADQQMHGVLVAGAEVPYAARDWSRQACTLSVNGTVQAQAEGTHPNGNATLPLAWLFEHARQRGLGLQAGDLITTGAWALAPVKPGDRIVASFPGLGEASAQIAG